MELVHLDHEINVFGIRVEDCQKGIGEAFDSLVNRIEGGFNRSFYGISEMHNGTFTYKAAAEETFSGEGKRYQCETFIIEEGDYLAVTIKDWRKKTTVIKDIFHEMSADDRIDFTKPFVEWYKNDDEMICMVKINSSTNDKQF